MYNFNRCFGKTWIFPRRDMCLFKTGRLIAVNSMRPGRLQMILAQASRVFHNAFAFNYITI